MASDSGTGKSRSRKDSLSRVRDAVAALDEGQFPVTIPMMSELTGEDRSSIHAALSSLVAEGQLISRRGRGGGYFPAPAGKTQQNAVSRIVELIEERLRDGRINADDLMARRETLAEELGISASNRTVGTALRLLAERGVGMQYQADQAIPLEAFALREGETLTDFRAVASHLVQAISYHPKGARLPSRHELSQVLGTTERTMGLATDFLGKENILVTRRGGNRGGTFVNELPYEDVIAGELTHNPLRPRLTQKQFAAHLLAKHVGRMRVGATVTVTELANLFSVGANTADAVRETLKDAGVLEVPLISQGTKVAAPPYRLNDVLVDEETAAAWMASADVYPLPRGRSGVSERVAFDIRRRIEGGELAPGLSLPNAVTLQVIYHAEKRVISQALRQLDEEQYLESRNAEFRVHSNAATAERLQGVSPLGKQIWHDREVEKILVGRELAETSLRTRYGAGSVAVVAALRQLAYVGEWRDARPERAAKPRATRQRRPTGQIRSAPAQIPTRPAKRERRRIGPP